MLKSRSNFANGLPGLGLLLLRLVTGAALIGDGLRLLKGGSVETIILLIITIAVGMLIVVGLRTRMAGGIVAILEVWIFFSQSRDPWLNALVTGLGVALALLGAGRWSVDARLSGWKRIEIRPPGR